MDSQILGYYSVVVHTNCSVFSHTLSSCVIIFAGDIKRLLKLIITNNHLGVKMR